MNKKSVFTASYLGVAAVWLGGHFGPGFATGMFSKQYYVQFGAIGIITPLLAMLITGGVMYYMLEFARSHKTPNYRDFALACWGEKFGPIASILYDIVFLMMVLCAGGLAVSGEATILQGQLGIPYAIGAIATIVISALLCLYGSRLVSNASKYMMYAIIVVVLLITILSLAKGNYDLSGAFANSSVNAKNPSILSAIWYAILYGCFQSTVVFNVVAVSDVLETKADSKKAIIAGYIITVVLMMSFVFMLFSYTNTYDIVAESLPVMAVLKGLGMSWLTMIYVLLMTLAVLSTCAGLAFAGTKRFDALFKGIKNQKARAAVITVILLGIAALGAAMGLKALLQTGTSVVGYVGIPVLVIPAFTVIRSKLKKEAKEAK